MKTAWMVGSSVAFFAFHTAARAEPPPATVADDRSDVIELDEHPTTPAVRPPASSAGRGDRSGSRDRNATAPRAPARERTPADATKRERIEEPAEPVSTTRTTAAVTESRRDVVESHAELERRERGRHFTVAPMLGGATNEYGVGFGARFGHTFATPVYLGANFMYHTGEARAASLYPSAEVGYDVATGPLVIRPYAGAGVLFHGRTAGGDVTSPLLYPGLTAHYVVNESRLFIGADGRVLLPLAEAPPIAGSVSATTGVYF